MALAQRLQAGIVRWLERRASTLAERLEASASANLARNSAPRSGVREEADECAARGDYEQAVAHYRLMLQQDPRDAAGLSGLGFALCHLGRFKEAAEYLNTAIEVKPDLADAHNTLGYVLRAEGRFAYSEASIRRALGFDPANIAYRKNLAETLLLLGRTREAQDYFEQILGKEHDDVEATLGLSQVAHLEGRFAEAEALLKRALKVTPQMTSAWAAMASLRKMSKADAGWLNQVQELLDTGLPLTEEVRLRFAIGKYWDDLGDYGRAFDSYRAANERLKTTVRPYDRGARTRFVDNMIRVYTPEALAQAAASGSDSIRPLFVVGMPRSGTSLVEQIISSHTEATGAGELGFWTEVLLANVIPIQQSVLPEAARRELADSYLRLLAQYSSDALRVVDKAPVNSEYLGLIHSVFPKARIIYVSRNPIDTCLSCYFQYFSTALSYTMDLADLAHYYRQHHRQISHWRAVLPVGTILDVPYEELVADQEGWTRRILEFIGLEWDDRCLRFQDTPRPVLTASNWQVRQKMYGTSVHRWRHYRPYIEALLELQDLVERPAADALPPAGQDGVSYRISYSIPSFLTR